MTNEIQALFQPFDELLEAVFIRRENRFRAEVELNGVSVKVHVQNRMQSVKQHILCFWCSRAAAMCVSMHILLMKL